MNLFLEQTAGPTFDKKLDSFMDILSIDGSQAGSELSFQDDENENNLENRRSSRKQSVRHKKASSFTLSPRCFIMILILVSSLKLL